MVKEFLYRGLPKEELENMSLEKLFHIFNARQRRSLTRGITDDKRKLIEEIKSAKAGKLKNPIKTHSRDLIILPYMVGVTVNIFSGKEFTPVLLRSEMIGHYLGEYVITNKRVSHGAPGVGASRSSILDAHAQVLAVVVVLGGTRPADGAQVSGVVVDEGVRRVK